MVTKGFPLAETGFRLRVDRIMVANAFLESRRRTSESAAASTRCSRRFNALLKRPFSTVYDLKSNSTRRAAHWNQVEHARNTVSELRSQVNKPSTPARVSAASQFIHPCLGRVAFLSSQSVEQTALAVVTA